MTQTFDVAVIGAGAAGMMAAAVAGQRGRKVVLLDHASRLAEKIRISGGGRCNFTNINTSPANFLSDNPKFCRSALAAYTPRDFLDLLKRHRIAWHEKHRGQLFCDQSSEQIIHMLRLECEAGGVTWRMPCKVRSVMRQGDGGQGREQFNIETDGGMVTADKLIVATGGLSIPKIGASDFGYRIARQFGLDVIEPRPALVPMTFDPEPWKPFVTLAGVALEVDIATGTGRDAMRFREDLLFTHRGLSGPAVLQISSYWRSGERLQIDLVPDKDLATALLEAKSATRQNLVNVLMQSLPKSLAQGWLISRNEEAVGARKIAEVGDKMLRTLADSLKNWSIVPSGSEGWRKAEVTVGGVDTRGLSQQTMEALGVPGLYFIGEVVDVTGWLGGYNFQWAWASGSAAGRAV